jgi:Zn-dependent protease
MGVGFGWAKPVPINPVNFRQFRNGIIRVSLAGVAANLMLVILGAIVLKIVVMVAGNASVNDRLMFYVVQILFWFTSFNMVLFVFNLIPIPPLDGSKVLMMLLPRQQAEALARIEPYGMFIIFGLLYLGILRYVFHAAQTVLETVLFKVLAI